jgi:hypothetical protein
MLCIKQRHRFARYGIACMPHVSSDLVTSLLRLSKLTLLYDSGAYELPNLVMLADATY